MSTELALPSFDEALASTAGAKKLLLGNGFSMAWDRNIFSYGSLYDRADFLKVSDAAKEAFEALNTRDFEVVMKRLRDAATLIDAYDPDSAHVAATMRSDADGLRDLLVETIAANHPGRPSDVTPDQYATCRQFLSHFETIYTLNYDLLLYWTAMQDGEDLARITPDDGFRADPDDYEAEWVTWDSSAASTSQSIYYIHGALHIYDAGAQVQKYTWCRSGTALVDQIRAALADRKFPLFVAEDSPENKSARIAHSGYLHKAYRSLESIGKPLFTLGFGFGDSDRHVVRAIASSRVRTVWVGVFGDFNSEANEPLRAATQHLVAERERLRGSRNALDIRFYDSSTVDVWGTTSA